MAFKLGVYRNGEPITIEAPSAEPAIAGSGWQAELVAIKDRVRADPTEFVWIGLDDPSPGEMDVVASAFDLNQLQVADALNPRQRARVELDGQSRTGFICMKVLQYVEPSSDIETGQISLFIGPSSIIVVRLGCAVVMSGLQQHIWDNYAIMQHGPLSVVHAVVDTVVDGYLSVIDEVDSDIQEIEESVFSEVPSNDSQTIYLLKRENLEIRRATGPLVSAAQQLVVGRLPLIPEPLRPFFHDVGDHLLRAHEQVESMDALLVAILQSSIARQDLQQNQDMRKIAAWAAILAVPTLIAGVYGMNFQVMPELAWEWGYGFALAFMGSVCFALYRRFKRDGWL